MPRVIRVLKEGAAGDNPADTVVLNREQRHSRRGEFVGVNGTPIALDLSEPPALRTGDMLVLDDGRLVEVVAEAEPLVEVRAGDVAALARLAWMLGDRHVPVEIRPNRLRLRRDPSVEALLKSHGAKIVAIEAPFDPEGGAYAPIHDHSGHDHGHYHDDHGHDHDHHSHDHHPSDHGKPGKA